MDAREDEGFYVLEGSVTIEVSDATVERGAAEYAFGPRDVPHSFTVGHDGAHMSWVITPGGFDAVLEKVRGPAEIPTIPPAHVLPPENVAAIALKHGDELL